ncbi:fungal-specific transcription factor domain-containing protein [Crucibulum laeve]|uniref:Fungal-specific transcription factor domain-containing protein n=1 Tax=Crucibulum laeve TaxID=68775 RepID=A0A5C3MFG2_9AGAR|nr:fungal-specific transcription factor domain-containing protein [Crucibulum laeve]
MPPKVVSAVDAGEDLLASRSQSKKRRIPGACDVCKKKKSDSTEMPGNRCTNCIQCGLECTHKEVGKTLGSAKGYVESLEARLEKMDRLLAKMLPGIDVNQEVENLEDSASSSPEQTSLPRNDDDGTHNLTLKLKTLRLDPTERRFFGKSSGYQLVQTALDLKQEYTGESKDPDRPLGKSKRDEFWAMPEWIPSNPDVDEPYPNYVFPEDDLLSSLIDAYFLHFNPFFPLLHRPTFLNSIAQGLHLTDTMFGGIVLLVCALGSRYSDDPRVFVENSGTKRSAGWVWCDQVCIMRKSLFKRPTLHELQLHAASETPQGIWAEIGLALRLCQEVGAHRRLCAKKTPSAEDELWKRAFWVILSFERLSSSTSGRPCGIQDEDFDLELPLECDDEYWEHGFQQPVGVPSTMEFFNCYLSLMDILAYAMRVIYSIKRPKNLFGRIIHPTEQQIISELDSAMNNWMDSVPEHLKWNPNCANELFLKQSAALYATYYHLQIFIHRPFIPSPRNPHPVTFPSLAICTNAARSCCHVLEAYSRLNILPLPHLQLTAFTSAVILLLNIWSGKRSGFAPNPRREMEDVQRCMEMLKACEQRWASAGRYWDILIELAFAGDLSIPNSQPILPTNKKRQRSDDEPSSSPSTTSTSVSDEPRSIAGSRRVSVTLSQQSPTVPAEPLNFSLPMYSNELGRLPIYGQFNFSDTMAASARDNRDRFPTAPPFSGHPSHVFDPSVQPQIDTNSVPDNLFTVADAFVKDALYNHGQMFGNNATTHQPMPSAVDLSSIFAASPGDFGDLSQFGMFGPSDNDTCMWPSAPNNFGYDEWSTFNMTGVNDSQIPEVLVNNQSTGYQGQQRNKPNSSHLHGSLFL